MSQTLSLVGTARDDLLEGTSGSDRIEGGGGNDLLAGGDGDDRLEGGRGDDSLDGGNGADRLEGGNGNDWLTGADGNDRLDGGRGEDLLIGGGGDDRLEGGDGTDTAVFLGSRRDYTVTLLEDGRLEIRHNSGNEGIDIAGHDVERFQFLDGTFSFAEVQVLPPPPNLDDVMIGTAGTDFLDGGEGNDVVAGSGGYDYLSGGEGTDTIVFDGNLADFRFHDMSGEYNLRSQDLRIDEFGNSPEGDDRFAGFEIVQFTDRTMTMAELIASFDETLQGGADRDLINGGAGNDTIFGNGGDDVLLGDTGIDRLVGGTGFDFLIDYDGSDIAVVSGMRSDYEITQSDAWTYVVTDQRADGDGRDTLVNLGSIEFGDGSVHSLLDLIGGPRNAVGTDADDDMFGTIGDDSLDGGAGNDVLSGGGGSDALFGGDGDDLLYLGPGNDIVDGGAGNDRISVGGGNQVITGGAGSDTYFFEQGGGRSEIRDFSIAEDVLNLAATLGNYTLRQEGADTVLSVYQNAVVLVGVDMTQLTADNFLL